MKLLQDKKILITGGSRGIGAAIVRAAMRAGADVAFTYHQSAAEANTLAQLMAAMHPAQQCLALQCDVSDGTEMSQTVAEVVSAFGKLDGLVNNAGITRDAVLARMSRDQWDSVISTNLGSMFNTTKPLILQMVKQKGGSIVNISSVVGIYGNPGQTNYAAAKAGIIGFTKALSAELAPHHVRVNAVAPGYIQTDMLGFMDQESMDYVRDRINMRRLGTVEDVAPLVCFLLSDQTAYITGQVIQVDGGLSL